MTKYNILKFLVLLLIVSNCALAKTKYVELSRISTEEGLSVGHVTGIVQDEKGFIWIATELGLNRYDGYKVEIIKGPDDVLEREYIVELYNDNSGNIWIGTQTSGIYSFDIDKGIFKHFEWPKSVTKKKVIQFSIFITKQAKGSVLLASKNKIFSLNNKGNQFIPLVDLEAILEKGERIMGLYSHGSTLYIPTLSSLYIYSFLNNKLKELPHLNLKNEQIFSHHIKSIIVANNDLWIASLERLFSVSVDSIESYIKDVGPVPIVNDELKTVEILSIIQQQQVLFLATTEGLYNFDINNGEAELLWKFSNSKYHLASNIIENVLKDINGNLWVSSYAEGVYFWRPSTEQFTNVFRQGEELAQLSNNIVWSLAQDNSDSLWIGTESGLNEFSLTTERIQSYSISKELDKTSAKTTINYIFPDESDGLWLVTDLGLKYFDTHHRELKPIKINNVADQKVLTTWMTGAYLDPYGYLWFVGHKHYYKYHVKTGQLNKIDLAATGVDIESTHRFLGRLPNQNVMLFSTAGKLWGIDLQTEKIKLIYQLPLDERQLLFEVDSWVVGKNDILWIAFTGSRLVGLSVNSFELIYDLTSPELIDDNMIYGLQIDNDGDLWFSSHSGIYNLQINEMFLEHYSVDDGLMSNEFNEGAYTKINGNVFAYGSVKGFTLFSPYELKNKKKNLPKVTISHISLLSPKKGRKTINSLVDNLYLNHDEIGLKIGFSTLEYERQRETQYRFWMTGRDKWDFPLSKDNTIQFGKLNAGNYVFNVQAMSPFSGELGDIRKIGISVQHAPWNSPFAYFCYFAVVVVVFIYWQKNRTAHINDLLEAHQDISYAHDEMLLAKQSAEKANKAKSTFLANISHELRTPMHSILSFSKLSLKILDKEVSESQNTKLKRYASNINQSGKRLLGLINNLLDIEKLISGKIEFNPKNVDFKQILTTALSEMEGFIEDNKIQIVVDKSATVTDVWAEEHLILQVLINLLSNAVKFSPEESIITISMFNTRLPTDNIVDGDKTILEVYIKDQGPGVPENELHAIFDHFVQSSNTKEATGGTGLGLAISQHILKLHHGKISVTNLPEKGACFSFTLTTSNIDVT